MMLFWWHILRHSLFKLRFIASVLRGDVQLADAPLPRRFPEYGLSIYLGSIICCTRAMARTQAFPQAHGLRKGYMQIVVVTNVSDVVTAESPKAKRLTASLLVSIASALLLGDKMTYSKWFYLIGLCDFLSLVCAVYNCNSENVIFCIVFTCIIFVDIASDERPRFRLSWEDVTKHSLSDYPWLHDVCPADCVCHGGRPGWPKRQTSTSGVDL